MDRDAHTVVFNGPNTLFSPDRTVLPETTCDGPRVSSSRPVPVDQIVRGVKLGTGWVTARPTLSILVFPAMVVALAISTCTTWSGVSEGRACSSRATAAEVTAVACEVPLPRNR